LAVGLLAGDAITETSGVDDGEEAIAQLALYGLREFYGDDTRGKGFVEHGPQSFADSGSVHDDMLRHPELRKGFYFAEDGDVVQTCPLLEANGTIGGSLEGLEGGQIYLQNAQSYGIARAIRL